MTLDEAITHAEKVAEEQEKKAKEWHENQVRKCELFRFAEMDYTHENDCKKCAVEHRQLVEWLRDYKRLKEQKPCKDVELVSVRQELLDRGDEVVSFRQLVERFEEVEEVFKGVPWNLRQIYTNFNILIGEKPCTDAISREAVLDLCDSKDPDYKVIHFKEDVECLPSVNPQPKMGRWISLDDFRGKYNENGFKCSECGEHSDYEENFCPNCGAKMSEIPTDCSNLDSCENCKYDDGECCRLLYEAKMESEVRNAT